MMPMLLAFASRRRRQQQNQQPSPAHVNTLSQHTTPSQHETLPRKKIEIRLLVLPPKLQVLKRNYNYCAIVFFNQKTCIFIRKTALFKYCFRNNNREWIISSRTDRQHALGAEYNWLSKPSQASELWAYDEDKLWRGNRPVSGRKLSKQNKKLAHTESACKWDLGRKILYCIWSYVV